jgi:YggT family protein
MSIVGQVLGTAVWLYILVLFARFAFDLIQMFSPDWAPKGPILVLAEAIYTVTDPPLKLLRRFIPPLRIGGVALDLSFIVLLILLQILLALVTRL